MFQVISTTPASGAVVINTTREIHFQFNDLVDPASISDLSVSLGIENSVPFQVVPGRVSLLNQDTVVFTTDYDLNFGTDYLAIITGGTYGIKSISGRKLYNDFVYTFSTEPQVVQEDPVDQPAGDPISGVWLDSYVPEPVSITAYGGRIVLTYEAPLDPTTTATIMSRHPLGRLGGDDLWNDEAVFTLGTNTITFSAPETVIPLDYESRMVIPGQGVLMENSIPALSYTVNAYNITTVLDLAVNREYTITVTTPDGTAQSTVLSHLGPMFLTLEETKLRIGALSSVFSSDDELSLILHIESQRGYGIWTGSLKAWPGYVPYYMTEYVLIRILRSAIDINNRKTVTTGATDGFRLGDLQVSLKDSGTTSNTISESVIKELEQMEYVLGNKLRNGDLGTVPIFAPAYSLMAPHQPQSGVIASVPTRGRVSPQYDPYWDRSRNIPYTRDLRRFPYNYLSPEID